MTSRVAVRSSRRSLLPLAALAGALATSAWPGVARSQCLNPDLQVLFAADGIPGDNFADEVSISGDVILVGAWSDDDAGSNAGSAYVYRRSGGTFSFEQSLFAGDARDFDRFGWSVAVDGDVAVVGSTFADGAAVGTGAAYVFRHDGTTWNQEAKIFAADSGTGFGEAVSVHGDCIAVGAVSARTGGVATGATYVFRHDGTSWNQEARLVATDGAANDRLGCSVAVRGDRVLAGAGGQASARGAAYLFRFDGLGWSQEQKLVASNGAAFDGFGDDVALDLDVAVVGAWFEDSGLGAAYTFDYDGSQWQENPLIPAVGPAGRYGFSVAVRDGEVLVGAPYGSLPTGSQVGVVHRFRKVGSTWQALDRLFATESDPGDLLGWSLAADGDAVVAGALNANGAGGLNTGAALVFPRPALTLFADPPAVSAGQDLALITCGGLPGAVTLLYTVDVNGLPFLAKLARGLFDSAGVQTTKGVVPPNLAGLQVGFLSIGVVSPSTVAVAPREEVLFQ